MAGISALSRGSRSGGSALDGFFGAQNQAADSVDRFTAKRADYRAGRAMKAADYNGAAGAYYDAGQVGMGSEVQNYGQAQEDRAKGIDAETTKKRGEFLVNLARGLKDVPDDQRNAQFERFTPALKTLGADDALIDQLRQAPKDNASLDMFAGGVEQQIEQYTLSPGSRRYDEKGQLIAEAPFAPQYKNVSAGDTLVQVGGDGGTTPGPDPLSVIDGLTSAGARVTSAQRTPEHNAEVGGAKNSYHLSGRARDIVPPPGMSMGELEQRLRASGANFAELINEGDHIHVAWAGEGPGPGAARVVAQGAPKAPQWVSDGQGNLVNRETGDRKVDPTMKGAATPKLAPQDRKYISDTRTAATQLANTVPLVKRFLKLNEEIGTGGMLGNSALASTRAMFDPKLAEMKSITDRLTPAMRQGMPGAASDRDVAMFQSATVGLGKPGPANQAVGQAIVAASKRQNDYVAYLEDYAKKNGSLLGAQEEWDAYAAANPMFDEGSGGRLKVNKTVPWRQYMGAGSSEQGSPAAGKRLSPAEAAKLKPGTKFIGMDGVERTRK